MAPYLTSTEAQTRLSNRFGITATLALADVDVASNELDSMRPFIGAKQATDGTQPRQFPRTLNPDGTENTDQAIPEDILDAVVLLAYQGTEDEGPAIQSESALDKSIQYSTPKVSVTTRRIRALIEPYLLRVGSRL